jgi:hypothetical protein
MSFYSGFSQQKSVVHVYSFNLLVLITKKAGALLGGRIEMTQTEHSILMLSGLGDVVVSSQSLLCKGE